MIDNKIAPLLQLALRYENLLTDELKGTFIVATNENLWEIIIQYIGDLQEIRQDYGVTAAYDLGGGFAHIIIPKNNIGNLSNAPNVLNLSLPTQLIYVDIGIGQICGSNIIRPDSELSSSGEGVLIAVIDSGIRYNHPDFITASGESRIVYLWDQSLGNDLAANNGGGGVVYNKAQINEALSYTTEAQQLEVVPSQDLIGHGTALAGIAAGNGRGSTNNRNRGVAANSELIIVKVNQRDRDYPRDIDIMHGIDFAIEKAVELRKPLIILLGIANNLTGHDGSAPLEIYMARRYDNWLLNFVIPMGNEGNRSSHTSGRVETGQFQTIQLLIEDTMLREYGCCIWKSFVDEMELVIRSPSGEQTEVLSILTPNRAYLFGEVAVLVNYSEPISSIDHQEIYILFQAQGEEGISDGLWTITIRGQQIIEGGYEVWGANIPDQGSAYTRFLNPDINKTLTSPATAYAITTVGAYNSATLQIAAFSGRGFTADNRVAPDLVAPGVNITVPSISNENLYTTITGTSAAAAFVAGSYAVLIGYGVYTLNNLNYYGEVLRNYFLRTAKRPNSYGPYPNNSWGYGLICLEAALLYMKEIADQTT